MSYIVASSSAIPRDDAHGSISSIFHLESGTSSLSRHRAVCALVIGLCAGVTRVAIAADVAKPAPEIAPPAPTATPGAVNQAKEAAKKSELTPLVPSPKNPLRPAFQLYAEIDLPILGIGLAFAGGRYVRTQQAFCAPECDSGTLNALDRTTAGYWSPGWQRASDVGLYTVAAGAAAFLVLDEGLLPALNDSVVVAESALAAVAVASMMTLATSRPRPFIYGDRAPLSVRNSADASLSYLSSHASTSFAIATSTFMAARRLHPNAGRSWTVLAIGGTAAAFVASARVLGGMHFITDSIGGSLVGVSVGVLVPAMHKSPVAVVPVVGETQRGLGVVGHF
jgi:membrane-associated phospholipid phosphatase